MPAVTHELRLATLDDIARLRRFIDEHWKPGHILARNEAFFRYEHVQGERVNFALALARDTGELDGVLGFLKYGESYEGADIWTVVWKVREAAKSPLLGLKLLSFLQRDCGFASVSSCGINQATVPIYTRYRFETGFLRHHYLINPQVTHSIAVVADASMPPIAEGGPAFVAMSPDELAAAAALGPPARKSAWYLRRRYYEHPIYAYQVLGTADGRAALIARVEQLGAARALRLVDALGDEASLARNGAALRRLVLDGDYEYADLYESGLAPQTIAGLGLRTRTSGDPNVIPTYFAPFAQKNVELRYATTLSGARICKADGDQDRPS